MTAISTYVYLGTAIVAEVIATSALKACDGFTRIVPTAMTVVFYLVAFWFLSLTLKSMPTGIVYGIWSGVGIVLICAVSWIWFKQTLDIPALVGLGLIVLGVVVVNLFSKSVSL
jgi:small multidrug resistance pump